jgi:hypothetical protein
MEVDSLTMEPIAEASISLMEESTTTTVQNRLLDMMSQEAGSSADEDLNSSDSEAGGDEDSGILDMAAIHSSDDALSSPENLKSKPTVTATKVTPHENSNRRLTSVKPWANHLKKKNDNDRPNKHLPSTLTTTPAATHRLPEVSPSSTTSSSPSKDKLPSSPPSSNAMESPTSVMDSIAGVSTIAGDNTHVIDDSPNNSCSTSHAMDDMEQRQKRHRRRHHLDNDDEDKVQQDHNNVDVAPEDLLGRLLQKERSSTLSTASTGFASPRHHLLDSTVDHGDEDEKNEGLISKRFQEIECKKIVLHQKRITLEQKLYDFVDSEKRMRVMVSGGSSSSMMLHNTSMMSTSSNTAKTAMQLLQPPIPKSPNKQPPLPHFNSNINHSSSVSALQPVYKNGDEMVQDYPWVDPRTKEVAYHYSGPLNNSKQPHGWGTMHFMDGQVYQGQIFNGYRWGLGTVSFFALCLARLQDLICD